MNTNAIIRPFAAAAVSVATAGALLLSGAGLVTAPGPADLTAPLTGSSGVTANAVFVSTAAPTKVLLWSSSYLSGGTAYPAGTPCSTWGLSAGERTTKQIQVNASGTQRKCV
jgi:hypothetical protein